MPWQVLAHCVKSEDNVTHHKFSVGQLVDFLPGRADTNVPRGTFIVERLLPPTEAGSPQYRIKHAIDRHERVVQEGQLEGSQGPTKLIGLGLSAQQKPGSSNTDQR